MATPILHRRGDIVVMVAWEDPDVFTNFCGATGISVVIDNAMNETQVGDCDDWSAPITTVTEYGAQTVSMTINAQFAKSNRDKLLRWGKNQLTLPIRVHIVDAVAPEVEYIDGLGMLPNLTLDGIGSTETNAVVTTALNIRFKDGVEFTDAT